MRPGSQLRIGRNSQHAQRIEPVFLPRSAENRVFLRRRPQQPGTPAAKHLHFQALLAGDELM